jgi:hypothetical protein
MYSMTAQLLRLFLVSASMLVCSVVGAQESPRPGVEQAAPLPDDELRQITVNLLRSYPELASSPGVKVAGAYFGGDGGTDGATVIYYPHTERRGIKVAFEAHCRRPHLAQDWTCDDVRNRRYLQVASQDFEVRVLAEISSEAALALIEASRRDLNATATDVSTAVIITDHHGEPGQYFIAWGTPDGFSKRTMLAVLAHGGNPTNPDDWRASIFEPPAQE